MLQVRDRVLQALLWQRAREPFSGAWALPGGTLAANETLDGSIRRQLADVHLRRELATAFLGLVPADVDPELPADTRTQAVATALRQSLIA